MSIPNPGPNPLRPYYHPSSAGVSSDGIANSSARAAAASSSKSTFSFPDLDYSDYLSDSSPSISESVKDLLDKAIWKYSSVLMAQPFDVAKTILQVYLADDSNSSGGSSVPSTPIQSRQRRYTEEQSPHSSDDEPDFFTSNARRSSLSPSPQRGRSGRPTPSRKVTDRSSHNPPSPSLSSGGTRIHLKNTHSLLDALSALSSTSGLHSLWKAANTTFIYSLLLRTVETFIQSLLATILGIADTDLPNTIPWTPSSLNPPSILNSTSPGSTLLLSTFTTSISTLLLLPIDTARTRLILTPLTTPPRTLLRALYTLPSLFPTHLLPITFLHIAIPTVLSTSTPLILKSYLNLDPLVTPMSYSLATFTSSLFELSIRYPLETVLRRAQIATFASPALLARNVRTSRSSSAQQRPVDTIVPTQKTYRGIVGTMWDIVYEEGTSVSPASKAKAATTGGKEDVVKTKRRKGQGVEGLYRGWRVGMWGLVGVWGAGFLGGLSGAADVSDAPAAGGGRGHGGKF